MRDLQKSSCSEENFLYKLILNKKSYYKLSIINELKLFFIMCSKILVNMLIDNGKFSPLVRFGTLQTMILRENTPPH